MNRISSGPCPNPVGKELLEVWVGKEHIGFITKEGGSHDLITYTGDSFSDDEKLKDFLAFIKEQRSR